MSAHNQKRGRGGMIIAQRRVRCDYTGRAGQTGCRSLSRPYARTSGLTRGGFETCTGPCTHPMPQYRTDASMRTPFGIPRTNLIPC